MKSSNVGLSLNVDSVQFSGASANFLFWIGDWELDYACPQF